MSDDRLGSWARDEDAWRPLAPAPGGVSMADMPQPRPAPRQPRRIRGVPGVTSDAGEDYQPGSGQWRPVR